MKVKREQWLRCLDCLPNQKITDLCDKLSQGWQIKAKALPQAGLAMLKLQDGAFHDPFYLGEIPLSTAWVEVVTPDGKQWQGAARIMNDDSNFAQTLAICDAILAHKLPGWAEMDRLVEQGHSQLKKEKKIRKAMLQRTMVNFSLLDEAGGKDED